MTAILVLHGRGESITHGLAHSFALKLRTVLQKNDMTDYEVIELGLSTDHKQDYNWSTYKPLDYQLKKLSQFIADNVLKRLEQDFGRIHLVGCSQGALLLRALVRSDCLDSVADKLDTFITLGAPNNGIYGLPASWKIDNKLVKCGYRFLESKVKNCPWSMDWFIYSWLSTSRLSFCSYWNSPDNSHRTNTFLALINNEAESDSEVPKKYLSDKVKTLVVISFENETVVMPAISTTFGYWDRSLNKLIPYNETDLYVNDRFGLRTLDERKALIFDTVPNERHMCVPLEFVESAILNYVR